MNRRGLWAAGVLLLLVGLVGVLAIGTGYAKDETEAAKCSEATLDGTYLFAQNGVEIKGDEQRPFALAGYEVFDGQGKVKALFTLNINTKKVIRNDRISLGRIASRRIAQAQRPMLMARVPISSWPPMAVS